MICKSYEFTLYVSGFWYEYVKTPRKIAAYEQ